MVFLVRMDVTFPNGMEPEQKAALQAAEKEYSGSLQREGILWRIWRVVGEYANYSVFDVESNDRLHEVLSGFPMFEYMKMSVTPLAVHPNSIR